MEEPPTKRSKLEENNGKHEEAADPINDEQVEGTKPSNLEDAKDEKGESESGTEKGEPDGSAAKESKASYAPDALRELDVGITQYISQHQGFSGVIKQRYSDFIVNEIDQSGSVVHLTDLDVPQAKEDESQNKPTADLSVLEAEDAEQLTKLSNDKSTTQEVLIKVGDKSKETRGKIHKAIREGYTNLESSTVDNEGGEKCIKVVYKPGGASFRSGRQDAWPKDRGNFTQCVLYKENKDTMEALAVIAKMLRRKPGDFTFAGTKDRRAKTSQRVSVKRVPAEEMQKLNKRLYNMALGNFIYCKEPLKLGDLKGNHFSIVLRNVTGGSTEIEAAMTSLKEIGFINYYGMQRFGTTSIPTHEVGRAILQSKWSEAVELILKPRSGSRDDLEEARQIWWDTRDAQKALSKMPRRHCIEKQLLSGLQSNHKNDLVSALNTIPRNSRLMYVHAYQSYIWNLMASQRIEKLGLKPIPGDLVLSSQLHPTTNKPMAVHIDQDSLGSYSIQDVVLPLPGYDVLFPKNEVGNWYKDRLMEDTLYDLRHKIKDYSLPGDYRPLVVKPDRVSWATCRYDDVSVSLIQSDLEKINASKDTESLPNQESKSEGRFCALKMEFSLPSSMYATMAIREVLKTDTSSANQATLNVT